MDEHVEAEPSRPRERRPSGRAARQASSSERDGPLLDVAELVSEVLAEMTSLPSPLRARIESALLESRDPVVALKRALLSEPAGANEHA